MELVRASANCNDALWPSLTDCKRWASCQTNAKVTPSALNLLGRAMKEPHVVGARGFLGGKASVRGAKRLRRYEHNLEKILLLLILF